MQDVSLTIDSGVEIIMASGAQILVNELLYIQGTPLQPVTVRGLNTGRSYHNGIRFASSAKGYLPSDGSGSVISNCKIDGAYAAFTIDGSDPLFDAVSV